MMQSQQSRVLVQLRDLILKGAFAPGERLAEIPLAERLGASRTPVRLALATLQHEGLIEPLNGGGYQMRQFTAQEVSDAIEVRGVLEGMAARLLAERGVPRQLMRELQDCIAQGEEAVNKATMDLDDYAAYQEMNNRFHDLIVHGCGNTALVRAMDMLNGQPFAAASATLPMQSALEEEGHRWMRYAHEQHRTIVEAIARGQGMRASALAQEHVEIARMNVDEALERPERVADIMPGIRFVAPGGRIARP
ncbi:GntR family transcriptional regulator [Azoarcus sp. DD4]|uniref:GntR family transcriptional regulator n=1 Tax=Azoarcus sp. DD4 TaxID=2027405 RepID=UPI00197AD0D8|nr:GntR family transcriptional regulator [Azoarcus sp. DD4]